jgi:ABC-type nitrate/sulfonate/bicarbonate transport system substrate-binding protein
VAGTALAAVSACSRREAAARLEKIRVAAPRRLTASSLYLADELGFFRQAGFEMEILQVGNSLSATALLAGGKMDVLVGPAGTAFLNAVLKGLPLRIVAGREVAAPTCGYVGAIYGMRRTFPRGLADLTQLSGKRVATGPAVGLAQFALDAHLARAGLSTMDVTIVSLDFHQSVAALLGGGVDAVVGVDDFDRDLTSLASGIVHTAGLAQLYPNFQYSYIIFGQTLLAADPDRGARFLSAYLRGAREFARGRTPRFMEEFARAHRLDLTQARTVCRNSFALDGAIDLNSLRLFADWAARRKHIPRRVEVSELVDERFLRRAHAS